MDIVRAGAVRAGMDRPVAPPSRLRRHWPLAAGALSILAAAAWLLGHPAERTLRVDADRIAVATVVAAPFRDFIPLRGEVVPLESVMLDVAQGGRVEAVLAEAGQRVTAGEPLIRFSDPNLELEAIARETQVIEQINDQRSLELSFEETRTGDAKSIADADYNILRLGREVARRRPLAGKGFTSQEALDQAADELAYQQHLKAIAEDAQKRDAALIGKSEGLIGETAARLEANLAVARRMLDALTVRAPVDGVLTRLDARIGEEKGRGARLGQIDRDGGFKVTADIDEYYLAKVRPGQRVAVTIDGRKAALRVAKIYPQVTGGRFRVDLAWVGAEPADLRPGQAVEGELALGGDARALILPAGPFLDASGGAWVFVLDGAGDAAERRRVRLGRRTQGAVEVLGGLAAGDRVVTSDYAGYERIDRLVIRK